MLMCEVVCVLEDIAKVNGEGVEMVHILSNR